jgi:translation initiation factor IF-2
MAEEVDKKPRVTLIKQHKRPEAAEAPAKAETEAKATHEAGQTKAAAGAAAEGEAGERKKIVVVKKKKPVVRVHAQRPEGEAGAPLPPESATAQAAPHATALAEARESSPEQTTKKPEGAAPAVTPPSAGAPASAGVSAERPKGVREIPKTERPNVVAGQVGPRRDYRPDERRAAPDSFQSARPASRQGIVGGRPVNQYEDRRPAYGQVSRPPYGQGGPSQGPRPYSPSTRPGGSGPRPYGSSPRPGGYGSGPRPYGSGPRPGGYGSGPGRPPRPGMGPRPVSGGVDAAGDKKKAISKKFIKAKKPNYPKKDILEEKALQLKKKQSQRANPIPKEIDIMESISVAELARKMNLKASDLIGKLMSMGMMVTINQQIDSDTAAILAAEYGCQVRVVSLYDETVISTEADHPDSLRHRPPIVTVMGHVDHGKTKLLDAIRKTDVAASEFGGITQHIGAYMVESGKGKITFLDTPGHEAFTLMRARGAQITDIVILVVAANDGVMPQTIEALNHAKEAKVPIIVAINKCDLPEANPDRVKTQLSELGLTPEDWGGDTIFNEISALQKKGIDELLDSVLVQAEMLELTANYDCRAEGKVLESKVDHGRGIVATVIIERGTLRVGDSFVAGIYPGRVRAIFDDRGCKIDEATPSMPVEIIGLEGIPNAGDPFQVTENEKDARLVSTKRQELKRSEEAKTIKKITLDNLYDTISEGAVQELKVIIKSDVQGSAEAVKASLERLSTKEVRLNVIHSSAGAINESDVILASTSNAILIAFNVRPTPKAKAMAEQEKVDIRKYNIIYRVVEDVRQAMEGMLAPELREQDLGVAEVREVFKVPKIGIVAGCAVIEGKIRRNATVHVIRDGIEIFSGKISSLKRFKDDVKEVETGFECGIGIDGLKDLQPGDQLEVSETVEVLRKLSPAAE